MAWNLLHTSMSIVAEATFADRFCASGYGPGALSCDAQNLHKQIVEPSRLLFEITRLLCAAR